MHIIPQIHLTSGITATLLSFALVRGTIADVLELNEKEDWIALNGEFTTIDFTGFKDGTFITDQYADLGVLFTNGNDNVVVNEIFLNDGAGLDGNQSINLIFDTQQTYISVDYPGGMKYQLFAAGELFYTSSNLGQGGAGLFGGLISSQPFDVVILTDWDGSQVFIDDLHFGFSIPGDVNHDGIVGFEDLFVILSNFGSCPEQIDPCPGNIDINNTVDLGDMFLLLNSWGPCNDCDDPDTCPADINNDCLVGTSDLLVILGSFGPCPDANYITCPADITFDGTVDADDIQLILDNWGE